MVLNFLFHLAENILNCHFLSADSGERNLLQKSNSFCWSKFTTCQMPVWFSTFNWTGFLELNNLNSPTQRRFQPQDEIAKLVLIIYMVPKVLFLPVLTAVVVNLNLSTSKHKYLHLYECSTGIFLQIS